MSQFSKQKQRETIHRREVIKASGSPLPSLNKLAYRQQSGISIEKEYFSAIQNLLSPYYKAVKEIIIPLLPRITQTFQDQTRVDELRLDNYWEMISQAIGEVNVAVGIGLVDKEVMREAARIGTRASSFNLHQMDNQFRSVLGINPLRNETYLIPQLEAFTARNTSLIKSIPTQSIAKIETLIRTSVEAGETSATLAGKIQQELHSTRNRAKLIARDQINKFNGALTELRQTAVGVEQYIWSTSNDERVRSNHRSKDGKIFDWNNPPSDTGHPGEDIQCRCVAIPVFNQLKAPSAVSNSLRIGAIIAGATVLLGTGEDLDP